MKRALLTFAVLGVPRLALACPVCFGNSDAPMAKATNLGIIAMLVVVVGMLASFGSFFIYLNRRARMVNGAPDQGDGRHAGPTSDPLEGTAQC